MEEFYIRPQWQYTSRLFIRQRCEKNQQQNKRKVCYAGWGKINCQNLQTQRTSRFVCILSHSEFSNNADFSVVFRYPSQPFPVKNNNKNNVESCKKFAKFFFYETFGVFQTQNSDMPRWLIKGNATDKQWRKSQANKTENLYVASRRITIKAN